MANTFTQLQIHVVFSVQNRTPSLKTTWRNRLFEYMTGIIQNHGHKLLQIGGVEDHVHILIGMQPTEALSELIMEVKRDSCKWINGQKFVKGHFYWQEGYGAFSVSSTAVTKVCGYIAHQEEHHKGITYEEEKEMMVQRSTFQIDNQERTAPSESQEN